MKRIFAFPFFLLPLALFAIDASDRYRSPRNPERAIRRTTELIVLHTTEAPSRGSLNKLSDRGECHYCVTEEGKVYRIIDRDREAFHAGRSMWNGKEDVDKFSIGIECVGYHNQSMPLVQLKAISLLVRELRSMYHLPDSAVVTHGHVAYGSPNRWQKRRHRGRKRCGMLFATDTVRRILGLKAKPTYDADVRARRLVVGDKYLNQVLYGGLDVMVAHYPKPALLKPAQRPVASSSSPSSSPKAALSTSDLVARGYRIRGVVKGDQTPKKIMGEKWNRADVFYTIRDKVFSGNKIDPTRIEKGTSVWAKE